MYGIINVCVKELIVERFGEDIWETIRRRANVEDKFIKYNRYPDSVTYDIVSSAAELLDMKVDEVWEIFGEYWVVWCLRSGFDLMISALGSSVSEFLSNLDFLHSVYLSTTYPQMTVPSFRVENLKDGTIVLHYYSQRSGLNGIVVGIVKAVASIIFDVVVEMEIIDWRCEIEGGKKEHTTFLVKIKDGSVEDDADIVPSMRTDFTMYMTECPLRRLSRVSLMTHGSTSSENKNQPLYQKEELNCPEKVMVDPQTFCKCFPYHVVFDGNLVIRQCGAKLQRLCPDLKQNGCGLDDFIVIKHPQISLNVASIRKFINMIFLVEVKVDKLEAAYRKIPNLSLRGQMVWMEELKCIIFLSSPRLISLQDLQDHNMHFSDIAPHDVTRDLILFNEQRGAEIELAKQLEEKKEELRILMQSLREEKMKTDALLYSMLPRQVANDLREGRHVEAGEFDAVTVLFADIVKFTDMCAKCKPIQIVNLLNVMYGKFDRLTNVHDVYKVETIGDAYMVVGGLPIPAASHAERVTKFGLGIIKAVSEVKSPNNENVQIRVGIHSGPVVAGVVGKKMPRYCLFGDTVNTASRMESHGIAGKVHISSSTFDAVRDHNTFAFEARGEINVKGKGVLSTYFCRKTGLLADEDILGSDWSNWTKSEINNPTIHGSTIWGSGPANGSGRIHCTSIPPYDESGIDNGSNIIGDQLSANRCVLIPTPRGGSSSMNDHRLAFGSAPIIGNSNQSAYTNGALTGCQRHARRANEVQLTDGPATSGFTFETEHDFKHGKSRLCVIL